MLNGLRGLLQPGIKAAFPALSGALLTTGPPGKSSPTILARPRGLQLRWAGLTLSGAWTGAEIILIQSSRETPGP